MEAFKGACWSSPWCNDIYIIGSGISQLCVDREYLSLRDPLFLLLFFFFFSSYFLGHNSRFFSLTFPTYLPIYFVPELVYWAQ